MKRYLVEMLIWNELARFTVYASSEDEARQIAQLTANDGRLLAIVEIG